MYRGSKLLPDHVNTLHELLLETSPDILPEFLSFVSDALSLPRALLHQSATTKTEPTVWRSCVHRSGTVSSDMCTIG